MTVFFYALAFAAEWSSQVARQIHTLEVTGSKPVSAIERI
jgi:hypothetical protein